VSSKETVSMRLAYASERSATLKAACLAALAIILLPVRPAEAHALVDSTSPAVDAIVERSPAQVEVRFSEPVELNFGALRVYDSDGSRVDTGSAQHVDGASDSVAVSLRSTLPDGTYTTTYRVVSADSHPIEGGFVFHVGAPGPRPEGLVAQLTGDFGKGQAVEKTAFAVARWVLLAGLVVLGGALFFSVTVWERGTGSTLERDHATENRFARRWTRVAVGAWIAALVATLISLPLQAAVAGGVPISDALSPAIIGDVALTRFGRIALLRVGLLLVVGALATGVGGSRLAPRRERPATSPSVGAARARPSTPPWLLVLGTAAVIVLLATPGMAGHAGTTPPVTLNLAADAMHIGAAAAWLGGLATLLLAAIPATRNLDEQGRAAVLAPVVSRFSDAATLAVAVIVVTGVLRSWFEVASLGGLVQSSYGLTLLAKVAVFVPLLVLGAVNRRWSRPRLEAAARTDTAPAAALGLLRRVVRGEIALGVVVVALTALLTTLPPARVAAGGGGPFTTTVPLGGDNLAVLVDPSRVGLNEVHLTLTTPQGEAVRVRGMTVGFSLAAEDIGPIEARGRKLGTGHFVVQGRQLSIEGEWTIKVRARLSRFVEKRARVRVEVAG
jgi:copper transport protein